MAASRRCRRCRPGVQDLVSHSKEPNHMGATYESHQEWGAPCGEWECHCHPRCRRKSACILASPQSQTQWHGQQPVQCSSCCSLNLRGGNQGERGDEGSTQKTKQVLLVAARAKSEQDVSAKPQGVRRVDCSHQLVSSFDMLII